MQNTRKTIMAINKVATNGDRFPCKKWGYMRRISWKGDETPKAAQELRSGKGSNWGGAVLNADQVLIIFDGMGKGPTAFEAWTKAAQIRKATS